MKVTMLGKSASGKTTYMASLYEVLGLNSVDGFYITPTPKNEGFAAGTMAAGDFTSIALSNNDFMFPTGTVNTTVWSFDLICKKNLVCKFEWIDYRGGILEDVISPSAGSDADRVKKITELLGHIALSNAVMIFIDSLILTSYENMNARRRWVGADAIATVLRNYALYFPKSPLNVIILLTKADSDKLPDKFKNGNYNELIKLGKETLAEVVKQCEYNAPFWQGGIIPVGAIGEKNLNSTIKLPNNFRSPVVVNTEICGFPEPMNVAHPLFFCLGKTLSQIEASARQRASEKYRTLVESEQERIPIFDWVVDALGVGNTREKLAVLERDHLEEVRTILHVRQFAEPLCNIALEKISKI